MQKRKKVLANIIELNGSLDELIVELKSFDWDCEEAIIELTASDMRKILNQYLEDKITLNDLYKWADALEVREDIAYEPDSEDIIGEIIFELASPEIHYPIDRARIIELRNKLKSDS